jgi:glycosyltransferase involved in cell wall biosynthesis
VTRLLRTARYERRLLATAAVTLAAGPDDARIFRRLRAGARIAIVPNGIAAGSDLRFERLAPDPTVAFTGTLDYPPNAHAARFLVRKVWPAIRRRVPTARLVIAGLQPGPPVLALARIPGVEVLPDVPDMAELLRSAWVAVAPMRRGAGIKNKVLEAWGVGRPVVMSRIAGNGLSLGPEASELVADRAAELAELVSRLLLDSDLRRRQSEAALRQAAAHPSWADSGRQVAAPLSEIARPIE